MKLSKWWLLACVPLALAACGMNDTEAEEDDPTDGAAADTAVATVSAAPVTVDTAASAMAPMMVPMTALGGSGVSGEATLTEAAGQTQVAVRLAGFQPNSSHAGHVHQGTCDAPGAPVAPLQDVVADASGAGQATSTVAIPTSVAMNGQHIIAYHQASGENMGPPIVCGAIPGHAM
ncbi:MAG: hypothetical protein AB1941_07130 [Gemmatimonadota bacterium]